MMTRISIKARVVVVGSFLSLCILAAPSAPAWAVATAPGTGWEATSIVAPTNLSPGGTGKIQLDIINTGAALSSGAITVTDALPAGLTATAAGGMRGNSTSIESEEEEKEEFGGARWACGGTTVITCVSNPAFLPSLPVDASRGGNEGHLGERIGIDVEVAPGASGTLANRITVAGGGASGPTSVSDPVTVSSSEPGFGIPEWDVWFSNADGTSDTQAGSHPYEATFVTTFNELLNGKLAGGEARNLEVDLPPGLFGDPGAVPQCTRTQLDGQQCPAQTQIGIDAVGKALESGGTESLFTLPVYNMVPPAGVPAEFAFSIAGRHAILEAGVRSANGYGIVEHIENIPQEHIDENILTVWGVPAEASHNAQRNAESNGIEECREHGCSSGVLPKPFLTLPTACTGPQAFTVHGLATWSDPDVTAEASVLTHDSNDTPAGFTGCEDLSFEPSLSAVPDTSFADTPAGLTVNLKVPQEALTVPQGLVASTIKNTTVTLPEGLVINPGQAAGLVACQAAEANVHGEGPQSCPAASKVGTVNIKTPLLEGELEGELEGNVYVLQSNPPNLQLLLAASADGIYLKLVGNVHLNEATGQLTTTFSETPELPFTDFKLSFSGGPQAALATPTGCGSYTTASDFTPWAAPLAEDVLSSSSFPITNGPGGSACASPLPFGPSMIAGSTTDQAGGFTDFSLLLQRGDGEQRIEKLQFKAPAGLAGMISSVPLCPEPQASQGACAAASHIGHAVVTSGPGPYPLVLPQTGAPEFPIYLTGSYKGAPFGLSIVTPVIAGPFNLGTIVTRAKIEIDPHTAQITVTTDPLPQIVDGVPTDLRSIDAVIDRPGFMFNPTNCDRQEFSGTATSAGGGATAALSSPFGMGSCRSLEFAPQISFSTNGKTSKQNGADLITKVTYPSAPKGTYANIGYVKVELPKALPSRLTTLQKACLANVFEENPAKCPPESKIGYATVHTPVLPVPLQGPAIFVSHGGEAFPSLTMVLQGYGVTIDLVGTTFISKAGITSTTFKTVPDTPFSTFELVLPQGPYSALTANENLCSQKLVIPNEWVGANAALLRQDSTVNVTGCAPAITVVSHRVKGKTATIQVNVPSAGKLVASGKGLSKGSKKAKGASTLTVKLTLTDGEAAALSRHKGRKLRAKIDLAFTPKTGAKLKTTTTVILG
jgi:hypothetical protein